MDLQIIKLLTEDSAKLIRACSIFLKLMFTFAVAAWLFKTIFWPEYFLQILFLQLYTNSWRFIPVPAYVHFGRMVRYPDFVNGQITVNADNATLKLIANSTGKLKLNGINQWIMANHLIN